MPSSPESEAAEATQSVQSPSHGAQPLRAEHDDDGVALDGFPSDQSASVGYGALSDGPDLFPVVQPPPDLRSLKFRRWMRLAFSVLLPTLLIWLIWDQLRKVDLHAVRSQISQADTRNLLAAVGAAITGIIVMGLYDAVAFPKGRKGTLPFQGRWALGSVLFGWTNFLSFGPLGGPAARMVMYSKFGLDSKEITRGFLGHYVASSSGVIGWLVAVWIPLPPGMDTIPYRASVALILAVIIASFGGRTTASIVSRHSIGSDLHGIPLVGLGIVSFFDWGLTFVCFVFAAHALGIHAPLSEMARVLFTGHVAGLISMIPGGIGSADFVWLNAFSYMHGVTTDQAAGVIILFRAIFFILPWCFSLVSIYIYTVVQAAKLRTWQRSVVSGLVAVMSLVLLASAATPAIHGRMDIVQSMEPLFMVEISHGIAVIAAITMILLVRGLLHGYRSAHTTTMGLLVLSALAQITKGMDYEIGLACIALCAGLFLARRDFSRKGRISIGWETALSIGIGTITFYLVAGFSAFPLFPYHNKVWVTFAYGAEESRFFRGLILLALVVAAAIVREAMAPSAGTIIPSAEDIERGEAFVRTHGQSAEGLLIGVGDKGIWRMLPTPVHPTGTKTSLRSKSSEAALPTRPARESALALYQHRSNRIIIAGDPLMALGTNEDEVVKSLMKHSEEADLELVFYMISETWHEALRNRGFQFLKLSDEAVIDIQSFVLDDPDLATVRQSVDHCIEQGLECEVIEPPFGEDELIKPLRTLSDQWFKSTEQHELQFSTGYFSPAYVQRNPLIIVRESDSGPIIGFANLLCCESGHAAGLDMLRYRVENRGSDQSVGQQMVDLMIVRAIEYLKQTRGEYQQLSIGLAPLKDEGLHAQSTFIDKAIHLFSAKAENVYHWHGLRTWKSRFNPTWRPRYMAYQHAWDWAPSLIACATLVQARSHADRARIAAARLGVAPISVPSK